MMEQLVKLAEYFEANDLQEYAERIDQILKTIAEYDINKLDNIDIKQNNMI